jgi:hypothetical protein
MSGGICAARDAAIRAIHRMAHVIFFIDFLQKLMFALYEGFYIHYYENGFQKQLGQILLKLIQFLVARDF